MDASFVQTDFRGGKWSTRAQGRMTDPRYKSAMNVSFNGMPFFNGPWTRRPGFLWGGNTRQGKIARLISCFLKFTEAFQLELTDGFLRAHVGIGNVFTPDSASVTIKSISTAKPAVVTVNGTLPSGWNNFDVVVLDLTAPSTSPILGGRQFQIQSISSNTFTLFDSLTGNPIDGSTQPYTAPTIRGQDRVMKILELTTPWNASMLSSVRMVQTDDTAVLMHYHTKPQSLTVPPLGNFALSAQSFLDGPYLNINNTSTTLTPSATSGNVTFTASAVTGINGGLGFLPTDVGRVLRFQSGPATWSSLTTYKNNDIVLGSDNNIYQSQVGSNLNHDPTTDNGVNWVITGQTIVWVWGYITTVTDTTHVVVAIQPAAVTGRGPAPITGDSLMTTTASSSWQLGLYSDTTGWPQGGTYHEGRLWLFGSSATNRVDASCSNDVFNMAPSAPDGTVGDGNAIAKNSNAPELSQIFWMLPSGQGVIMGTRSGEWLIHASTLNDPITPTDCQIHRGSTYGCANIEPQLTELTMCFVQREQQRIMNYANYPYGEAAGWFADNMSEDADDIVSPGIADIKWQQEPSKWLWARCNDGSLIATTFNHPAYGKQGYNGWHTHAISGGRTAASISTGPSDDGLTTTLFVCAFNPATGFYEYLELGHVFDKTQPTWAQNFTDGIAQPSVARERAVANGDAFNGITIFGLFENIGQTITLSMGGLDIGDFTVLGTDGHIDVPYTATFTKAFLLSLNNGTNYGVYALEIQPADASSYTSFGFGGYNPPLTNLTDAATVLPHIIQSKNWLISHQTDGLRLFNLETLNPIMDATTSQIFYGAVTGGNMAIGGVTCYHPGTNCLYCNTGSSNSDPIQKIDMSTMRVVGSYGVTSNSFLTGQPGFAAIFNSMIPLPLNNHNYISFVFELGAGGLNGVGVLDADTMTFVGADTVTVTEPRAWLCLGPAGQNLWYGFGTAAYSGPVTTAISVYNFSLGVNTNGFILGAQQLNTVKTGSVSPAQIDATWTHFSFVSAPAHDPTDDTLIAFFQTTDSVTNKNYWAKINPRNGNVVWTAADAAGGGGCPFTNANMMELQMPLGLFRYVRSGFLYTLATGAGTLTNVAFPATMTIGQNQAYWPEKDAIVSAAQAIFSGSPPGPYDSGTLIPLGTYMTTSNSWLVSGGWSLITAAAPASNAAWPPPDLYSVPVSIGGNYTSQGQLLRPDFERDAGAQNGPAFGKKRRLHWFAAAVERAQNFFISTDNTFSAASTDLVTVMDEDENVVVQPNLYTGTLTTTMPDNYSFDSQIAWEVTRPTPLTITAMGGYIATQDK